MPQGARCRKSAVSLRSVEKFEINLPDGKGPNRRARESHPYGVPEWSGRRLGPRRADQSLGLVTGGHRDPEVTTGDITS